MSAAAPPPKFLPSSTGVRLAWRVRQGAAPTLVFLPGYASDMAGAKALALDALRRGARAGDAAVRLFGHRRIGRASSRTARSPLAATRRWRRSTADRGPLVRRRLVDGRLDRAPPRAAPARPGRRAGRDRRRARLHQLGLFGRGRPRSSATGGSNGPIPMASRRTHHMRLLAVGRRRCGCSTRRSRSTARCGWSTASRRRRPARGRARGCSRQLRSADVQLNIVKGGGHRLSEPHEIDCDRAHRRRTCGACYDPAARSPRSPRRPRPPRRSARHCAEGAG